MVWSISWRGGGINIHIAFKNQISNSIVSYIVNIHSIANKRNSIENRCVYTLTQTFHNVKSGIVGNHGSVREMPRCSNGLGKYTFLQIKKMACEFRELVLYVFCRTNSHNSQTAVNRKITYYRAGKWQIHKNAPLSQGKKNVFPIL